MKKSIIVLLIAVLVSGFAFAAKGSLTGTAGLNFGVDLEKQTWGFANPKDWTYKFSFEYDTTKVDVAGDKETKAWAELGITGTATASLGTNGAKAASGAVTSSYTVTLSKATINFSFGEGDSAKVLVIDITGAGSAKNYVTSFSKGTYTYMAKPADKKATVKTAAFNVAAPPAPGLAGFNFTFDGFTGGLGAAGRWTDEEFIYNIFLHAKTKSFEFAEKAVKVEGAVYTVLSNDDKIVDAPEWSNNKTFGGGLQVTYGGRAEDKEKGIEADKLTVKAMVDLKYDTKNEKLLWEVGSNGSYQIAKNEKVSYNLYLTQGKLLPQVTYDKALRDPDCKAYYTKDYADALKLDAKVGYDAHTFTLSEGNTLALSGSVEIDDALVPQRELIVGAKEVLTLKVDKSLVLTFEETYKILYAKTLDLSASATYTAKEDKFVAKATVAPSFQFADSEKDALTALKVSAEIYSEKVISLAKIGLKYASADFAKTAKTATAPAKFINKGTVTAYVEIKFPNALPKKDDAAKDAPAAK